MMSTIAACSATWIGWSKGSRWTVVPMSTRSVSAASAPSGPQRGGQVAVGHHVVLGHEDAVEAGLLGDLAGGRGSPASAARCSPPRADPAGGRAFRTSSRLLLADGADGSATNERLVRSGPSERTIGRNAVKRCAASLTLTGAAEPARLHLCPLSSRTSAAASPRPSHHRRNRRRRSAPMRARSSRSSAPPATPRSPGRWPVAPSGSTRSAPRGDRGAGRALASGGRGGRPGAVHRNGDRGLHRGHDDDVRPARPAVGGRRPRGRASAPARRQDPRRRARARSSTPSRSRARSPTSARPRT